MILAALEDWDDSGLLSHVCYYLSKGYTLVEGGNAKVNTDFLPYRGTSAGGGYSTVIDLLRFANALREHQLLNLKRQGCYSTER